MARQNKLPFTFVIPIILVVAAGILFLLFYLMSSSGPEPTGEGIVITAVGDSIGYNIQNEDLSHLVSIIDQTDVFIFNLEGVLVDSSEKVLACKGFPPQSLFTANSTFVEYLKLAPITIANMGNNHVLDCGSEGIKGTKKILFEYNILSVGVGENLDEACEPLFVEVKDRRIAFVSYNFVRQDLFSADAHKAGAAFLDGCQHDYGEIRSQGVDLIVASIHYGLWSPDVKVGQVLLVNKLFDSGVDMVIGHSPHMPQAVMVKDGKLAFFSLGNFILRPDYEMPPLAHTAIVTRVNLYADRTDVTIYPLRIDDDGIPHIEEGDEKIISRIAIASKKFDTFVDVRDNLGHISFSHT